MVRRYCRYFSRWNNGGGLLQLQQLLPGPGGIQQLLVSLSGFSTSWSQFPLSYGDQYAEQGAQSSELVAKQEDGGLFSSVDRIFFGGQGLSLPLAITLFLVDVVVSEIVWGYSHKMTFSFLLRSLPPSSCSQWHSRLRLTTGAAWGQITGHWEKNPRKEGIRGQSLNPWGAGRARGWGASCAGWCHQWSPQW